jgi:hypothetical protein
MHRLFAWHILRLIGQGAQVVHGPNLFRACVQCKVNSARRGSGVVDRWLFRLLVDLG